MYIEIDEIFNNLEINFSNNEEKEIFIKLGKTLKAYNEIKINKYNLQGFLDEKKKKYLCKIISFYSKESIKNYNQTIEKLLDIKDDYYYKLLSFKINEPYSKKELKNIIDNIPFRFFNIYVSFFPSTEIFKSNIELEKDKKKTEEDIEFLFKDEPQSQTSFDSIDLIKSLNYNNLYVKGEKNKNYNLSAKDKIEEFFSIYDAKTMNRIYIVFLLNRI